MSRLALTILDDLIREKRSRQKRTTNLLKDPSAESGEGWYMCVPPCFNEALDIKRTECVRHKKKRLGWTQGSWFSFKQGDTVYDTADAYKVWSEALKSISLGVQVKMAYNAGPSDGVSERFSGSVTFSILTPNRARSKLVECAQHTMSQDEFVSFLIAGPCDELETKVKSLQQ